MKKWISLLLVLMLLALFTGCNLRLPEERPDDFAIRFEWGVMDGNFLDTFEGKVGRDMVSDEDITADYTVSEAQLDEIYTALRQYGIAAIRTEMTSRNLAKPWGVVTESDPTVRYSIQFTVNGREYTVNGDDSSYMHSRAKNFRSFNKFMTEMIAEIWEEMDFPQPNSAYY